MNRNTKIFSTIVGLSVVVLLGFSVAQEPRWPAIYFSSVGSADADISVVRTGEPASPSLEIQLTTSDTLEYAFTDGAFNLTDNNLTVNGLTLTPGDTYVSWAQGATAADALDSVFFVAPRAFVVKAVRVTWGTAESTGAMDVMVEKLNGVTACGSGTDVLAAVVDATGTANTTASPAVHGTAANLEMAAGDNLCVDLTATPNEVANLTVTVQLGIS